MKVQVGGGQFFLNGYPVKERFTLQEGESRLLSYISDRGAGCGKIRAESGRLSVSGSLGVIRWGENAEIYPAPEVYPSVNSYTVGKDSFTVYVGTRLLVRGDYTLTHLPKTPLSFPTVRLLEGQRTPMAEILADCAEGHYLAVLSLDKRASKVLLEVSGESVTTEGNEVCVLSRLEDIRCRRVTSRYLWRGSYFEESYHNVECTNAHPFIREECGRLLLEAVAARDEGEISRLVTSDIGDPAALYEYFGDILVVRTPLFTSSPTAVAVQKNTPNGVVAILYDFAFEGDKIKNIICLED